LDRREAHRAVAELAGCYLYCLSDKKYVPNAEGNPTFNEAKRLRNNSSQIAKRDDRRFKSASAPRQAISRAEACRSQ